MVNLGQRCGSLGVACLVALAAGTAIAAQVAATTTGNTPPRLTADLAPTGPARLAPGLTVGAVPPAPTTRRTAGTSPVARIAAQVMPRRWLSGAAGDEAADGRYGAWRGEPIDIGGTWDDNDVAQVEMYSICGGDWAHWTKPLDVAVGAIDVTRGESWAAAARGVYDARWRKNLEQIKSCWGDRDPGRLYIRFAHEMNLPNRWQVRGGQERDFVRAITRYSTLRYAIIPRAKIVLCPNDGTDGGLGGLDLRKLWPGRDGKGRPVADVYAVDSYNSYGLVRTRTQFLTKINALQRNGAPQGIEQHRRFAASKGVPFAISEWSNDGDPRDAGGGGESPEFVREFNAWARAHSGDVNHPRPGQLLYELHFNLWRQYQFWPTTMQPKTASAYRSLTWGH